MRTIQIKKKPPYRLVVKAGQKVIVTDFMTLEQLVEAIKDAKVRLGENVPMIYGEAA